MSWTPAGKRKNWGEQQTMFASEKSEGELSRELAIRLHRQLDGLAAQCDKFSAMNPSVIEGKAPLETASDTIKNVATGQTLTQGGLSKSDDMKHTLFAARQQVSQPSDIELPRPSSSAAPAA